MTLPPEIEADANRQSWKEALAELHEEKRKTTKIDVVAIVDELMTSYKLRAKRDSDHPIYMYNYAGLNEGIFTRAETQLAEVVKKHYPGATTRDMKEIYFTIWTREGVGIEPEEFDSDTNLIHFNNGWFNLKNWCFESHMPERPSLTKSRVDYNPEATCPVTDMALDMTLSKENQELYLKMAGYCFLPTYAFKKAFVMIGPKDSGKTTFKELIGELVGWHNVAAVAWSDIEKPYMAAELEGKMVNLASEISKAHLLDVHIFKKLTGDDTITSRKIRQEPTTFKNRAKMIIAVNDMPEFEGVDEAAIGRIIVIDFDRQFRDYEIDKDLLAKMSTSQELSGLLNRALTSLKQVITDNGFNEPDLEEKVTQYRERTSELKDFVEGQCELEPLAQVPTSELLTAYSEYCLEKGRRPLADKDVGIELKATYRVEKMRDKGRRGEKRPYYYRGIRLRNPCPSCPSNFDIVTPIDNPSTVQSIDG